MSALIPIQARDMAGATQQTVNARELHAFLGNGMRFNDWIKKRVAEYGFRDGIDFQQFELQAGAGMASSGGGIAEILDAPKNVALESTGCGNFGQQGRIEYALTLDMAKELSMVERNEKGKQARAYFLECERKAKAPPTIDPMRALNDPAAMRSLLLTYCDKVLVLEDKVAEQAPKVEALELLTESEGSMCVTDAGKVLGITRDKFFRWLHSLIWIYKRANGDWTAHAPAERAGYVVVKVHNYVNPKTGEHGNSHMVRITPKGMAKLATLLVKRIDAPKPTIPTGDLLQGAPA